MSKLRISPEVKLKALAMKYYDHLSWHPELHDLYTIDRADDEVFEIVDMRPTTTMPEEIYIVTRTNTQESPTIFSEQGFTSKGFGEHRVYIHPSLHNLLTDAEFIEWYDNTFGGKS